MADGYSPSYSPDNDIEYRTARQYFNPACNSSKMKLGLQLSWPQPNSPPSKNIMRNSRHYTLLLQMHMPCIQLEDQDHQELVVQPQGLQASQTVTPVSCFQ